MMPILIAPPSTPINTTKLATISASSASIDDELAKATNESLTMGSSIVTDIDNVSFIFPPRHKLHPGLYVNNRGAAVPTDDANSNPMADNDDDITAVVTSSLLNCHLASMQLYHTAINNHDSTTSTTQNNMRSNSMISTTIDNSEKEVKTSTTGQCSGVPGFPDFPDCWDGIEPPSTPKMSNRRKNSHYGGGSSKSGKQKRCCHRRKIHRTAVNASFGSRASSAAASVTILSRSNTGKDMKRNARDERKLRRIVKVSQLKERRRRKRDMGDICRGMAAIKW